MRAFGLLLHSLKLKKKKKGLGFSLNVAPLLQEGIFKLRTIVLNFICIYAKVSSFELKCVFITYMVLVPRSEDHFSLP